MKCTGTVTELHPLMSLSECSFELKNVVVLKDSIDIEWYEEETYGLLLSSIDAHSTMYTGPLTVKERPTVRGFYTAYRWNTVNKGILLLATWKFDGNEGVCMFDLEKFKSE